MKNVRTKSYRDLQAGLPEPVRTQARLAFRMFVRNPDHPSLRRHPLDDTHKGQHRPGSFSVSINRRYRAIYVIDGDTNVWYWVGTHADYDTFTGRK